MKLWSTDCRIKVITPKCEGYWIGLGPEIGCLHGLNSCVKLRMKDVSSLSYEGVLGLKKSWVRHALNGGPDQLEGNFLLLHALATNLFGVPHEKTMTRFFPQSRVNTSDYFTSVLGAALVTKYCLLSYLDSQTRWYMVKHWFYKLKCHPHGFLPWLFFSVEWPLSIHLIIGFPYNAF